MFYKGNIVIYLMKKIYVHNKYFTPIFQQKTWLANRHLSLFLTCKHTLQEYENSKYPWGSPNVVYTIHRWDASVNGQKK